MTDRDVLSGIPLFAEVLDEASLTALAAGATRVEYDRGAVLIEEHAPGESMFVIVRGAVAVSVRDGGKERRVATLHDGEVVGEMSLLTGAPRAATVTAMRPTVAIEIPRSALAPILAAAPDLADHFAAIIEGRKKELDALYGERHWLTSGSPASEVAERVRRFFSRAG